MRVIAGTARGRPLRAPRDAPTRPTGDLVKGVVFSMLEAEAYKRGYEPDEDGRLAAAIAWPRVLDLFAGSGALGIEALSRGAQHAQFVEQDRGAVEAIRANLRILGLEERATLIQQPAHRGLARVRRPVDLALLDPPYGDRAALDTVLDALDQAPDILAPHAVLVLEQSVESEPPSRVGPLRLSRTRVHGRTRVSLYVPGDPPAGGAGSRVS